MSKKISQNEPILAFGAVNFTINPHSILVIKQVGSGEIIANCFLSDEKVILSYPETPKIPMKKHDFILVQQKYIAPDKIITRIKDVSPKVSWKTNSEYEPSIASVDVNVLI